VAERVRMVATDLDGTLLRSDGTVSERTRRVLHAATDAGLLVVFVSGRPTRWLDDVREQTGHVGVAVGANGAVVYDLATGRTLSAHTMDTEVLAVVTGRIRVAFPAVQFAVERLDGFGAEPGYAHDWAINPRTDRHGRPLPTPPVAELSQLITAPAVKLLAKDRAADADEFLARGERLLAGLATVTHSSAFGLLEIAAPEVSKASGLAELADRHGISAAEVVAIGDMPNDVPMLRWAGRSYAVAGAHPFARAAADEVIGANDEDAVAALIETLL
jgi:Cof subfamily protein (haloacid dehalogenase superfamily)